MAGGTDHPSNCSLVGGNRWICYDALDSLVIIGRIDRPDSTILHELTMAKHPISKSAAKRTALRSPLVRVRQLPHWSRLTALIVGGILVPISAILMLSSQAASYPNALVAIADVNGGFYNGFSAVDADTGKVVGSVAADLPQLAGCSTAQPRAYMSDFVFEASSQQILASVKACAGGTLPANQSIVRLNTTTFQVAGYYAGPGSDAKLLANPARRQLLALSADGLKLQTLEASTGRLLNEQTFSSGERITRWAINPNNNAFLLTQGGTLIHLDLGSFARQNLANTGVSFSSSSITPDIARIAVTPNAGYALGKQNGNPVLVAMTNLGQITTYPIANEPMSLTLNPAADHVFLLTGCPAGSACSGVPNRLYAFSIASQAFEQAGPDNFIPLQTLSHQIRFGPSGNKIYFDGVVAGADGIGQRFVFSLDAQGTAPQTARVAIPGVRWEPLSIVLPSSAPGQGTVPVPGGVPAGGGIGANNGGIATNPIPIDEIERQIGMPIALIDFSTITDEQIRAYGYDPAAVRRYVAQLKLQQATTGSGAGGTNAGCFGGLTQEQAKRIESAIGVPIAKIDLDTVTDAQIRAIGLDVAAVREYAKQRKSGNDPCANVFTQEAFVTQPGSATGVAAGSATNLTVQPVFDLLAGGWLMEMRWQAPGGAAKFLIYGRDNKAHQLESQLAMIGSLERKARFGGFGRVGLAPVSDATYVLSVVPQQADGTLGSPAALKVRTRCFVVWCTVSSVK